MTEQSQTTNSAPAKTSWWLGLFGLLELFLGFIALVSPWLVGLSFMWVIGIFLMVFAVIRLIQVFAIPYSRWWNLITAILYGIVGFYIYQDPAISAQITTLLIGWGLLIAAVFRGAVWFQTRSLPAAGWRLFNVIITLVLGLMVVLGWPESTAWFIGTLVAVELIFSGWTLLLSSFGVKVAGS